MNNLKKILFWIILSLSLFLILVLNFLSNHFIPASIQHDYFYLVFSHPNPVRMYLSNFIHISPDHIRDNIFRFLAFSCGIYIIEFIIRPWFGFEEDEDPFVEFAGLFITALPFLISVTTMVIGSQSGFSESLGFSGMVWALAGYLLYDSLAICDSGKKTHRIPVLIADVCEYGIYFIIALLFVLIFFGYLTPSVPISEIKIHENIAGHVTGFSFGLLMPWIIRYRISHSLDRVLFYLVILFVLSLCTMMAFPYT